MTRKIKYISDKEFRKMTKKEKLSLESYHIWDKEKIDGLLIIPTNQKNNGYCLGHFFAYTNDKGWWKPMIYDCWSITTDIENPATFKYQILQGDFELDGFNIFSIAQEHHIAFLDYGGRITIKNK